LITTGLIGVIYDSMLKPRMLADIKSSLDIDRCKVNAIAAVAELPVSRWRPRHSDVLVITPSVAEWLRQGDWHYLCAEARASTLVVRVYGHLDDGSDQAVRDAVAIAWADAGANGVSAASRGSTVVIFDHPGAAQVSLYRSGDAAIVGFDAPFADYLPGAAVGLQISRSDTELWQWVLGVETRVALRARQVCRVPHAAGTWR